MTDLLVLSQRLKNVIALGESHFREFKSALEGAPGAKRARKFSLICDEVGEALVAFANADGGDLLIGVEDDGQITGVLNSDAEVNSILAAVKTHVHASTPLPIQIAEKVILDGHLVLFFSVQKGSDCVYQLPDGRCMVRRDKASMPAHVESLMFERAERVSRSFDREFVDGAQVSDLDIKLVGSLADSFIRGLSPELYLQQMGLAEYGVGGLRLRVASVLLFASDISRWHARCQVRVLKVSGTEIKSGQDYNVHFDESVSGNIFALLQNAWEMLRPHLAYRTRFGEGSRFEQDYIYPEEACREALVNALAHRDYTVQNGVEVIFYDDRLEIKSPGLLLSTINVKDIEAQKSVHESRNALIARVLRESALMRELGEGFQRIFKALADHELDRPGISSEHGRFSVIIKNKSVFSAKQEAWLSLFSSARLNKPQKKIVVLGMDNREISANDIFGALNTSDRDVYDREVTRLRKAGILIEIRSPNEAAVIARLRGVDKKAVPRYGVRAPSAAEPAQQELLGPSEADEFDADRTIFVGSVAPELESNDIAPILQGVGPLIRHAIKRVRIDGQDLQYVLAEYSTIAAAISAINALNGRELHGLYLRVSKYKPRQRRGGARRGRSRKGGKGEIKEPLN